MFRWLRRFRNEHEDEGSLKVHIEQVDPPQMGQDETFKQPAQWIGDTIEQLLLKLARAAEILAEGAEPQEQQELQTASHLLLQLVQKSSIGQFVNAEPMG
jgi:hypothetical protein